MQRFHGQRVVADRHAAGPAHAVGKLLGGLGDGSLLFLVGLGHGQQQPGEAGHVGVVHRREVGAAVEGTAVGGQEHRHGPAAAACEHLDGLHVDGVQVGPLLPVDLYADEVGVHQRRNVLVLEGLPFHNVAPVAGRIADAQQDGLVLGLGPLQGLLAPGVPVHGIIGVLQEVGAGLVNQAVGHELSLYCLIMSRAAFL